MSYCRFSSDDYQSDVYCYADVGGGYTTHVASNKRVLDMPLPPKVPYTPETAEAWMERHEQVMAWVKKSYLIPIGLTYDGETFNDPTASDAAYRLQMLKDTGYHVPMYAIAALREEALEQGPNIQDKGRE